MDTKELLKKVRTIEIKTRGLSRQMFSGEYHSAFKGRGMAFSEVREYFPGDDVRTIDWNVTARLHHPYVKVFEEERELTVMLLVDVSGSQSFGTSGMFKRELITELSAVLSFSAIHNNDKTGVIFFSDKIEKFIPPKKGKSHTLRIIRELIEFQPESKGTDVAEALRFMSNVIKKRAIVFILSDFLTGYFEEALQIAARRHDTVAMQIYDEMESSLPNIGLTEVLDAETGEERMIDTSDGKFRKAYEKWWNERQAELNRIFLKANVDIVRLKAGQSYISPLRSFFKQREKRR